jgi:Domain of unknown function (DUF4272)
MAFWPNGKTGPPEAEVVQRRAIILRELFVRGFAIPPPSLLASFLEKWTESQRSDFNEKMRSLVSSRIQKIREMGLWKEMEESERRFIEADALELTEQELLDANWLAEAVACLLWALEYLPQLPPYDERVDSEMMKIDFNKRPALRPFEDIKKQRDLAELWHWRAKTRQLQELGHVPSVIAKGLTIDNVLQMASAKAAENGAFRAPIGNDFPAFNKAYRDLSAEEFSAAHSIALERHRAFNWLCGHAPGNRWTETPTDT